MSQSRNLYDFGTREEIKHLGQDYCIKPTRWPIARDFPGDKVNVWSIATPVVRGAKRPGGNIDRRQSIAMSRQFEAEHPRCAANLQHVRKSPRTERRDRRRTLVTLVLAGFKLPRISAVLEQRIERGAAVGEFIVHV